MQKQKESLSTSTAKLIVAVSLIVGIGSVIGALGYFWTMQRNEIAVNEKIETSAPILNNGEVVKFEAEKYLPAGYAIISNNSNYDADIDNDGTEEKIILIKEIGGLQEKFVIFKPNQSGYEMVKTFELDASNGAFFGEFNLKDINNDKIPEIIYAVNFGGSGESMPKEANIIGWNGKDYEILLKKDMVLYSYGRSDIGSLNQNLIKDLNNDGIMEVAIPRNDSLYQAYCKYPSPGCVSLLKFDVYNWDGVKYIEATNEFLSAYDEEIKLAKGFLEDPNIQKDNREKIEKYLKEIDNLKIIADWEIYRNEEYGYEVKYPNKWEGIETSFATDYASFLPEKRDAAQAGFWIRVYKNLKNLPTKEWWNREYIKGSAIYELKGEFVIAEIIADVYKEKDGLEFNYYVFSKDDNIFLIFSQLAGDKIDQILSTFKFIEK